MTERWKPVAGCDGRYEVSDQGRVRSWTLRSKGGLLSPQVRGNGYRCVLLTPPRARSGKTNVSVHRLVAAAFIGECPEGHQVAHLNGNGADNRLENLVYATAKENCAHRDVHGTTARGEKNGNSLINRDIASKIKRLKGRVLARDIAAITGISRCVVHHIWQGKTWSHV